jgi:hypothetical protein
MLSSIEKLFIISCAMCGSLFLFNSSLNRINDVILRRNFYNAAENSINNLLITNGATMMFSGYAFSYLAYIATK